MTHTEWTVGTEITEANGAAWTVREVRRTKAGALKGYGLFKSSDKSHWRNITKSEIARYSA